MTSQESLKTRLGDILLEKGLITNDQLQFAINAQKTSQLPLGEILIENKWVTQWQIKRALRTQSKLRNAVLTSILSLSPLALVGCGSAGETTPEAKTSVEEVVGASQTNQGENETPSPVLETDSGDSDNSDNSPSTGGGSDIEDPIDENVAEEDPVVADDPIVVEDPVVEEEAATLGIVQLSWSYPEERTDGSDFNVYEIQGFKIYQLSGDGSVDTVHEVDGLDTDFLVENLPKGEHSFAITVVDTNGLESDFSETISIPIS